MSGLREFVGEVLCVNAMPCTSDGIGHVDTVGKEPALVKHAPYGWPGYSDQYPKWIHCIGLDAAGPPRITLEAGLSLHVTGEMFCHEFEFAARLK